MMEAYENIKTRKSIRAFESRPISKENMRKIVDIARNSPSYTNTQPWEMAVVTGKQRDELSRELLKLVKRNAPTNSDIPLPMPTDWPEQMEKRLREHGARRLNTIGIERTDKIGRERLRLMNFEFYGAPCAVFLFMDDSLPEWSLFDIGLFVQNLILSAHCFGIGSCIQASVTEYAGEIKTFLHIEKDKKLVACISLGYPDKKAKLNTYRSVKKASDEFMYWYE